MTLQAQFERLQRAGWRCWCRASCPSGVLMERFREGAAHGPAGLRAGGVGLVLGRLRRAGRCAAAGGDRQAAVSAAERSAGRGAVAAARSRRAAAPSTTTSLPEAAVALKQGAGRLIRRETDQGVLVVCDTRLATMGYGRRLLAALPPMRRLEIEDEFDAALRELGWQAELAGSAATRTSTTDRPWPLKPLGQVFALRVVAGPARAACRRAAASCPARRRSAP